MDDVSLSQCLLADLRARLRAPALDYAEPPARILSGAENLIYTLRLTGGPACLAGPLVLRCYKPERDHSRIHFEAAIHGALVEQGYPAPRVVFASDDPRAIGGAYLLMDRLPGRMPLAELTRLDDLFASRRNTLRTLPRMIYEGAVDVPRHLARWMLALHALDPKRIAEALGKAGFSVDPFTIEGRLESLEQRVDDAGLDGLRAGFAWLHEHQAPTSEIVLCHGDFHFLNLLAEGDEVTGVLDWSHEHLTFADPAFDVGNTRALFDIQLPGVPAPLRPVLRAAQRRLGHRFTARYQKMRRVDPRRVLWAEAFRYLREMVAAGEARLRGESAGYDFLAAGTNPWLMPEVCAGVIAGIERRTGVAVSLPERA